MCNILLCFNYMFCYFVVLLQSLTFSINTYGFLLKIYLYNLLRQKFLFIQEFFSHKAQQIYTRPNHISLFKLLILHFGQKIVLRFGNFFGRSFMPGKAVGMIYVCTTCPAVTSCLHATLGRFHSFLEVWAEQTIHSFLTQGARGLI